MNHQRNAVRFCIIIFWLIVLGVAYSGVRNMSNSRALGWPTWLLYGSAGTAVLYGGAFTTKKLWSIF